jgi:hypothetical protein
VSSTSFYSRRFLAQEEVGVVDSESNLITLLSNEAIPERLKGRQKE